MSGQLDLCTFREFFRVVRPCVVPAHFPSVCVMDASAWVWGWVEWAWVWAWTAYIWWIPFCLLSGLFHPTFRGWLLPGDAIPQLKAFAESIGRVTVLCTIVCFVFYYIFYFGSQVHFACCTSPYSMSSIGCNLLHEVIYHAHYMCNGAAKIWVTGFVFCCFRSATNLTGMSNWFGTPPPQQQLQQGQQQQQPLARAGIHN